jgi:hypothetical protein
MPLSTSFDNSLEESNSYLEFKYPQDTRCHPWFFAQHTSSGIVGCLQNSLFCWREDKRARDSFENIPSYQENLHSRFFLF